MYLNTECGINRVFVRSTLGAGTITVQATRNGLTSATASVISTAVPVVDGLLPVGTPPPPTVPPAPTGLTAAAGNTQVVLGWSAASGATSYNVKRATVSGGPYTNVATGVTVTSYTNTGLTNGTTYYYVVSGVNAVGEGANSTQVSATPTTTTATVISRRTEPGTPAAFSRRCTRVTPVPATSIRAMRSAPIRK